MKKKIKLVISKLSETKLYKKLRMFRSMLKNLVLLISNTTVDGILFFKHSMVFKQDTINKIESRIILHYHGIEKGFLFKNFKYRFGENRVKELVKLLKNKEVVKNHMQSQIAAAYLSICTYYEKHQTNGIDISDYFSSSDYLYFKSLSTLGFSIVQTQNRSSFFKNSGSNFLDFSKSRESIRNFTGEKISFETIIKVIELAKTAPSVCNRQPTKVYYVENKETIMRIFAIQQGFKGYSEEVIQLLILVSDRSFFYTIGERNQLYIDGGIFLMNLLYSLHFYKIGACPAHCGFNYNQENKIHKELNLSDSEKVICLVPIGIPNEEFNTTLSLRRDNEEILKVVNTNS